MKKNNTRVMIDELSHDLDITNNFALDIRSDLLLGEATLAEYATYVRFCLKRLEVIIKVVEKPTFKDLPEMQDLLTKANTLKASLMQMKQHGGTKKDTNASITCNSLLNSYKKKYIKYLSENEIEEIFSTHNF